MPDMMTRSPPPIFALYLRKLGAFGTSTMGNDLYYLKEFVDMCIHDFGEEKIVEMLKKDESLNKNNCRRIGENWEKVKRDLNKFDVHLSRAKGFFDKVEKKDFKKVDDEDTQAFLRYTKKVPLIKNDIYCLFVFLIKNSALQRTAIPPSAWKVLEHLHLKKIDATRKRPETIVTEGDEVRVVEK